MWEMQHQRCQLADALPGKDGFSWPASWPPRLQAVVPNIATLILEASTLGEK